MKADWLQRLRQKRDEVKQKEWVFEFKMGIILTIVIIIVGHALALLGDH